MKNRITNESRNLLIAMLLGDGTICAGRTYKLAHCLEQQEFLEWKIKQMNDFGITNNGLKTYISSSGYNKGKTVVYTQVSQTPFVKTLHRVMYKPRKVVGNRKMLNRLDARGVAIWYMDDGALSFRKTKDKIHGIYVRISTCSSKEENQVIIDYFRDVWNVSFYQFKEGKETFSLCCGTKEAVKFIEIVKPYVSEIPSMVYKIHYDLSQRVKDLDGYFIPKTLVGNNAETLETGDNPVKI